MLARPPPSAIFRKMSSTVIREAFDHRLAEHDFGIDLNAVVNGHGAIPEEEDGSIRRIVRSGT